MCLQICYWPSLWSKWISKWLMVVTVFRLCSQIEFLCFVHCQSKSLTASITRSSLIISIWYDELFFNFELMQCSFNFQMKKNMPNWSHWQIKCYELAATERISQKVKGKQRLKCVFFVSKSQKLFFWYKQSKSWLVDWKKLISYCRKRKESNSSFPLSYLSSKQHRALSDSLNRTVHFLSKCTHHRKWSQRLSSRQTMWNVFEVVG